VSGHVVLTKVSKEDPHEGSEHISAERSSKDSRVVWRVD
jgi:hypothetical protein